MIISQFKKFLRDNCPNTFHLLISIRFFLYCRKVLGPIQKLIAQKVFNHQDIQVLGGPFRGMNYYNKTIWGTITGKWLGCYEQEINPVIEEIIHKSYPKVIDVGAAEGYYAVGLALKMPNSKVISYDVDPIARFRQRQLAQLNEVTNLEIRKYCSHQDLSALEAEQSVVICDIEGYEMILMDPRVCPNLNKLDLLVEMHHFEQLKVAEVAETIEKRFEKTHEIQRFYQTPRNREEMRSRVPALLNLSDQEVDSALDEGRYPGQVWLWMKAKRTFA